MKYNEDDLLKLINDEIEKSDKAPLPEALQKDQIAKMLEEKEDSGKIPAMSKGLKKQRQAKAFRTFASLAAVLIILFGSVKAYEFGKTYINDKTDTSQGSKDKNSPDLPDRLQAAKSYRDIENIFLEMRPKARKGSSFDFLGGLGSPKSSDGIEIEEENFQENADDTETNTGANRDHGETNLQVEGVDEADLVKTDGTYIYKLYYSHAHEQKKAIEENGSPRDDVEYGYIGDVTGIQIIKAYPARDMKIVSSTPIYKSTLTNVINGSPYGYNPHINEFYLLDGKLYVILSEYADTDNTSFYQSRPITSVLVYDINNKAEPRLEKSFSQDGSYISSRITNNRLILLTSYEVNLHQSKNTLKNSCIPNMYIDENIEKIKEEDILLIDGIKTNKYLVLSNINLKDLDEKPTYKTILGGGSDSYCTKDSLYVSNVSYDYESHGERALSLFDGDAEIAIDMGPASSHTEIFSFDITKGIEFKGYGYVPGHPLNQFAMDEYKDHFRIATTSAKDGITSNNVYVMDKDFKIVGKLEGLAKGETIHSVRFMGDTAYVVTFVRVDPLFVIDMSRPDDPKVLGELEIPGFSQYLHPAGDGLLIGVGVAGDESGRTNGVKISLFDVRNPHLPQEISVLEIPGFYAPSSSHKAFLSIGKDGLYAIPINSYYSQTAGLLSFKLEDEKIKIHKIYQVRERGYFHSPYDRGTYINDVIYHLTANNTHAFSIESGELLARIES